MKQENNMAQQLEFPFTAKGALQAYNLQQLAHMNSLYREFLRNSDMKHRDSLYRTWVDTYVKQGAIEYETKYLQPRYTLVEHDNERVLDRWKRNSITKPNIDDYF